MRFKRKFPMSAFAFAGTAALTPGLQPPRADKAMARDILVQLISINASHAKGSLEVAEAIDDRFQAEPTF